MNKLCIVVGASCLLLGAAAQAMPFGSGPKVKWSQGPDMIDAQDNLSMHRANGPVVADDFVSNGEEIYGFHWWGSYFLDAGQDPTPGSERYINFEVSFHENCVAGSADPACVDPISGNPYPFSTPKGRTPGSYWSDVVLVEEDYYGQASDGTHIFEYWWAVDPNNGPDFLDGTWKEEAGETYWVDFAWDASQFTDPNADVWGWAKAANGGVCILDCAVQTAPPSPGGNPHLGPWASLAPEDKAFEVYGVPEPAPVALLALGLLGAGLSRRRRTR